MYSEFSYNVTLLANRRSAHNHNFLIKQSLQHEKSHKTLNI